MANKDIEKKMKEAQEAMLNKSKPPKKEKKSKRKPIKEVYTEIKESLKPQVKENIDEEALIQELFKGETTVEEILNIEPEEPTRHRDGL
jgi:ribosomal protein S25